MPLKTTDVEAPKCTVTSISYSYIDAPLRKRDTVALDHSPPPNSLGFGTLARLRCVLLLLVVGLERLAIALVLLDILHLHVGGDDRVVGPYPRGCGAEVVLVVAVAVGASTMTASSCAKGGASALVDGPAALAGHGVVRMPSGNPALRAVSRDKEHTPW